MIEVIYQGEKEKTTEEEVVKLPKNVRQIGDCVKADSSFGNYSPGDVKIYVEDFVMTYIKHFGSNQLRYGVLLGNIKRSSGYSYFFITGAICAKPVLDNEIIYDEKVWTGIYEDIKMYFDDVEILGWFVSMPGMLENDMLQIQKIHLDNFAGNDKVCFIADRVECEDSFYYYSDGKMNKCNGHFIYYEKNENMQSYMLMNEEVNTVPEDYEQSTKQSINAKVHKLLYKKEEGLTEPKRLPTFAYSVSSFMIIAVLLVTIALMNASGQMEELKSVVAGISKEESKQPQDVSDVNVIEAGTNPKLTTTAKDEDSVSKENETTKEMETTNQPETTKEPETVKQPETTKEPQTTKQPETTKEPETIKQEEPTSKPTVVPIQPSTRSYTVKPGDSLYSISINVYGSPDKVEKIKEINNLKDKNYIKEGDIILLP